jgi:hypothetical protein
MDCICITDNCHPVIEFEYPEREYGNDMMPYKTHRSVRLYVSFPAAEFPLRELRYEAIWDIDVPPNLTRVPATMTRDRFGGVTNKDVFLDMSGITL